ncbi:hypothetical protein D6C97_10293 [Aureobasidium pullulans]|nr:hypothetical protein D6C97_10293 [Aureobasidium pullulans]
MSEPMNPERLRIQLNAATTDSRTTPFDTSRTLLDSKQRALEATQKSKRTSADREVSSQVPMSSRNRSQSRAENERVRIPKINLMSFNEHEENAPSQPSANTFQSALSTHTLQETTQDQSSQIPTGVRFNLDNNKPPGAYVDSSFADEGNKTHAPIFDDENSFSHHDHDHEDFDPGNVIDDTLLDITKDYELNLNDVVTNALRQKTNSHIDTLEQYSALDAEDFAARVAQYPHSWFRAVIAVQQSHRRAEDKIDDLSEEINVLESNAGQDDHELNRLRESAHRRETRLLQCQKIIPQQQDTLSLQQSNIADLQDQVSRLQQQLAELQQDRGRHNTRSPRRQRSPSRDKSWSPSQMHSRRNTSPQIPLRASEAPSGVTHATARTTVTGSSSVSRPLRVPDPPEFDNKSSVNFSQWKVKMRIKLFTSGDYDDKSENSKLDYILSRTGGSVFERLLLRMPDGPKSSASIRFHTAQDCLDQLNDWYGDRHRQTRAYTEFETLSQKYDESFADFLTRFQECVGYMNLPEEHELQKLQHKLNARYGQRINDGTYYASIKDVIRRGDALDAHFTYQDAQKKPAERERRPQRSRNPSTSSQSSNSSAGSGRSHMTASTSASSVAALPKLTDELRDKLRAEGRCFRCREKGHTSFNCPKNNRINHVNHLAIMPADDAASETGGVPLAHSENE